MLTVQKHFQRHRKEGNLPSGLKFRISAVQISLVSITDKIHDLVPLLVPVFFIKPAIQITVPHSGGTSTTVAISM